MADISFYDFDFNLLRVLPPFAMDIGYKAINTQQDLNNSGSLEIVFRDPLLKSIAEEYKANIIVQWRDFQGFLTSYRWTDKECRITGMHLNGLLKRAVIPVVKEKGDTLKTFLNTAITNIDWLNVSDLSMATEKVTYGSDKPKTADTYIQDLLDIPGYGYAIEADIQNKKFIFNLIKPSLSSIMLSKENLNLYGLETTYINKAIAFGGWYKVDDVWKYITTDDTKTGIYKIDTVLNAETEAEALNELRKCKGDYEVTANVKIVENGKDYRIGDIVRVQADGVTQKKLVSGVNRWEEKGYGENPIFTEYEEGI